MHISPLQAATWATVAGSIASAVLLARTDSALPIAPPQLGVFVGGSAGTAGESGAAVRRQREVRPGRRGEPATPRRGR